MIRRVSGETRGQRMRRRYGAPRSSARAVARTGASTVGSAAVVGGGAVSVLAISITDAIERFDLCELVVDRLELLAQPLDVAVDGAVVDIDVLAIGRVHQLVAVLDVAGALRQRLQDQELGDGQLHLVALPGAQMPAGIEGQLTAYDRRLALAVLALSRELAAPQQRADALDQ